MSSMVSLEQPEALCNSCGIPFDSQYFDDSSVVNAPDDVGEAPARAELLEKHGADLAQPGGHRT